VRHATFLVQWGKTTIYVDPVGGAKLFAGLPPADLVLITHLHADHFDPAGRDNGYLLQRGGKTIYIAGDTEDIPEIRKLPGVDVAFLPMNTPYTMSVEQAADAIRAFRPRLVYPYHYRNGDGTMADIELLKKLIGPEAGVEVRLLKWYP